MASSKDYLDYVMDLLADVPNTRYRAMMGEYVLYADDKVFGGIYDDRFLVKSTKPAQALLSDIDLVIPYANAKPMIVVPTENRQEIAELVSAIASELPLPKRKKSCR